MPSYKKITPGKVVYFLIAAIWFFIAAFPLYFTLISSFKENSEIFAGFFTLPTVFHFENYVMAQKMSNILRSLFNSVMISLISIVIMVVLDLLAAYVVARKKVPLSGLLTIFLSAALMIPIQCALIPIVQMVAAVNGQNNYFVLIIVYVALNMSFCFFILLGSITDLSREIDESAEIDGCGLFSLVFRIIAPMLKPAVATCAIISFLFIYNELAVGNVLLTVPQMQTISVALLQFKGDFGAYYSYSFAAIVIAVIPTLAFYLLAQEKVEKGLTTGAVKG